MISSKWAFDEAPVYEKLKRLPENIHQVLVSSFEGGEAPSVPARDAQILATKLHPEKKGFSSPEGSARMLHDLASIELQAMELGLRTLVEFPDAPSEFREALAEVTLSEGEHLKLCLSALESLGFEWGHWPVHCNLWMAVEKSDSLLDRILIVHRYLEGSGLDAGSHIIQRLQGLLVSGVGVPSLQAGKKALEVMEIINREEVGHVLFGSNWYHSLSLKEKLDPEVDFKMRMESLRDRLPRRFEKLNHDLRRKAGFTDQEIQVCESFRQSYLELGQKKL